MLSEHGRVGGWGEGWGGGGWAGGAKGSAERRGGGETTEGYDGLSNLKSATRAAKGIIRYTSQKLVTIVFRMIPLRSLQPLMSTLIEMCTWSVTGCSVDLLAWLSQVLVWRQSEVAPWQQPNQQNLRLWPEI